MTTPAPESERANMWSNRIAAADRYQTDATFHALVDMVYAHVCEGTFTPTELREACILAATMYEMTHARPMIFGADNLHDIYPKDKK